MEPTGILQQQLELVPEKPGVYIYKNRQGAIIYIGKAKNLRRRVFSYFNKFENLNAKTQLLVKQIHSVDTIVVNNESESLLLENNLIKTNKPKYNINLKDDKSYPWVCVTHEEFPRILITRKYNRHLGEYYGPYTQVQNLRHTLKIIRGILPYRTCKLALTDEKIVAKAFSPCLEYHIKACLAPCISKQSKEDYQRTIATIVQLLNGKTGETLRALQSEMQNKIDALDFEEAERIQNTIQLLSLYKQQNAIVNPDIGNQDCLSIIGDQTTTVANYLQIRDGRITLSINKEIKNPLDESEEVILLQIAPVLRTEYKSECQTLLTNIVASEYPTAYKHTEVPQRGDKHKILNISIINARKALLELSNRQPTDSNAILEKLQKDLNLQRYPYRIECIDNSNTLGTFPVSSCVVFLNGRPAKKEYRIYNVKTVVGANDYDTMREVVMRRYEKRSNEELPDLLIMDGGRGQLNVAISTLKEIGKYGLFDVVALAEKMEEVYVPRETYPLFINKNSTSLRLLQQLRDEAHNTGVKAHSKRRDSSVKHSELENIPGLGPKSIQQIYQHYSGLDDVAVRGEEELSKLIGHKRAKSVLNYILEKQKSNSTE